MDATHQTHARWITLVAMWMTGREVETQLEITHGERTKLVDAGLLRPIGNAGRAVIYDKGSVEALNEIPIARIPSPAIAVRLGPPQSADDETEYVEDRHRREWRGWSEEWDERTKIKAASMWWEVADPARLVGGTLLAVVAHVVVGAWAITGYDYNEHIGRVAFRVEPTSTSTRLVRSQLRLGRGPLIKVW